MPGLEQLKQFSEDVAKLGNELTIREERGDAIVEVPLPTDISVEDDSDDFVLGMPLDDEGEADDAMDVDATPTLSSSENGVKDYAAFPELDSLLNPEPDGDIDFSDFPELAAILDSDSQGTSSNIQDLQDLATPDLDAVPDMDLVDFDTDSSAETELDFGGEPVASPAPTSFDLPDFDSLDTAASDAAPGGNPAGGFDLPDFDSLDTAASDAAPGGNPAGGFDLPDFDNLGPDVSVDSDENDAVELDYDGQVYDEKPSYQDGQEDAFQSEPSDTAASFDLPDFDAPGGVGDAGLGGEDPEEMASPNDTDFGAMEESDGEPGAAIDFGGDGPEKIDTDFASMSVSDEEFGAGEHGDGEKDSISPENHEIFDAPDDPFDGEEPPPEENFDNFVIPGISDQAAGAVMAKPKRISLGGKDGKKEKNTLTDKEYETFLKNLKNYPLNLRIELQKLIVSDEFKDEVVFDLIQKVLKKISARQLATQLEKLLDINIPVPREFERRTAAQYEEYKKSAEYQLKNRILPIAIISVMAACILYFVFLFGWNFIYEPLRANSLYKEGYALLEEGAYPQSEIKFDEASTYQQQKRWFFRYADGYRQHKQYERARMIYKAGLRRFKQDKELGLAYAAMELYDLRNFENAEAVVRREVLDYHINDPDGMLFLGDIFLEWGDERDPAKYEDARQVYDDLLQLYGQKDLYLARMMRYYIRVDSLRNVLQMKEYFYPKKKGLEGQDLIELSGYLLDKISGNIAPADEYLLSSIEDVRELLERAVEAAPDVPESLYNMGLYFMNANNSTNARDWLSAALTSFEEAQYKPRKRLLRQLNTYRLLGDLDVENGEYISAEEQYRTGVGLFEKAAEAGLVGDSNVGQLYAALGDINFFHTGDYDEALRNYSLAAKTQHDVPAVSYKMGYINYSNKEYEGALDLFIKTMEKEPSDTHVLLALGNTLSARGDNFAAQGYYQRLIDHLDRQMVRYGILFPHSNDDHAAFISIYKRASNNLGVTLYRLARQTGNSTMNADALTNFTASIRAFDSLYRNPETLVRQEGSNLAERNIKYMSMPVPDFEPSIYTEIEPLLEGEVIR